MWDKSQLLRGIVRAGLCMLTLFSPAEQAQAVLLKWVEPPCRSEGCCLLTLTRKQSLSDPPHLNYQHNSDYSCILCMELQLWGSPGHYPHVACVIWIPPPLCGYKCTRAEEQGAERVIPTATGAIISSPKSTSALALRIFTLLPSMAACCSQVRRFSSPVSICSCSTQQLRLPLDHRQLPSVSCQFQIQGWNVLTLMWRRCQPAVLSLS